jgi:hypothetical protein
MVKNVLIGKNRDCRQALRDTQARFVGLEFTLRQRGAVMVNRALCPGPRDGS